MWVHVPGMRWLADGVYTAWGRVYAGVSVGCSMDAGGREKHVMNTKQRDWVRLHQYTLVLF